MSDKLTEKTYGVYEPASLAPPSSPSSPFPRLLKWTVGVLVILRISFILGLLSIGDDRGASPSTADISVPPLGPAFYAKCNSLLKSTPSTYVDRLSRLVSALQGSDHEDPAVWVAEPGPSSSYFIGAFSSSDWSLSERPFLIAVTHTREDRPSPQIVLLTPEFERLRAQLKPIPEELKELVTWVSWPESSSPYEVLRMHLRSAGEVMVDPMVRSFITAGLRDSLGQGGTSNFTTSSRVEDAVALIRERKDEREIGLLRCANQMTLHAIRKVRSKMYIGITESQTRTMLKYEFAATGLVGGDGLVLFGENAALPHGSGTDRVLGETDFVLIDAGGKWGGYVSDITRTFALPSSKIPESYLGYWETVRQAQVAPYDYLSSSNTSYPPALSELDVAARRIITSYMNREPLSPRETQPDFSTFTHRLGHGIGLEGHEGPYLVQGPLGAKRVQTGHVFSLEPGIYIPLQGHGSQGSQGVGVRLEDCFVVRADEEGRLGGEWLSGPVKSWGDI